VILNRENLYPSCHHLLVRRETSHTAKPGTSRIVLV
jgi:hypothetical protein